MATVEVSLQVEEIAFVRVMKTLKKIEGVAQINWNLDLLDAPKKTRRASPEEPEISTPNGSDSNGSHPKPDKAARAQTLKELLVSLLAPGPKHVAVLRDLVAKAGFSPAGVHGCLNQLGNLGITEGTGVPGLHRLTPKAMARMQQARPALPPPTRTRTASVDNIMKVMQDVDPTPAMKDALVNTLGISRKAVDNAIYRARKRDLVRSGKVPGEFVLTAKGRKFKPDTENTDG